MTGWTIYSLSSRRGPAAAPKPSTQAPVDSARKPDAVFWETVFYSLAAGNSDDQPVTKRGGKYIFFSKQYFSEQKATDTPPHFKMPLWRKKRKNAGGKERKKEKTHPKRPTSLQSFYYYHAHREIFCCTKNVINPSFHLWALINGTFLGRFYSSICKICSVLCFHPNSLLAIGGKVMREFCLPLSWTITSSCQPLPGFDLKMFRSADHWEAFQTPQLGNNQPSLICRVSGPHTVQRTGSFLCCGWIQTALRKTQTRGFSSAGISPTEKLTSFQVWNQTYSYR